MLICINLFYLKVNLKNKTKTILDFSSLVSLQENGFWDGFGVSPDPQLVGFELV